MPRLGKVMVRGRQRVRVDVDACYECHGIPSGKGAVLRAKRPQYRRGHVMGFAKKSCGAGGPAGFSPIINQVMKWSREQPGTKERKHLLYHARASGRVPGGLLSVGLGVSVHQDRLRALWHRSLRRGVHHRVCRRALPHLGRHGHTGHERGAPPPLRSGAGGLALRGKALRLPDQSAIPAVLRGPFSVCGRDQLRHRGQQHVLHRASGRLRLPHGAHDRAQGGGLRRRLCGRAAGQPRRQRRGRHELLA